MIDVSFVLIWATPRSQRGADVMSGARQVAQLVVRTNSIANHANLGCFVIVSNRRDFKDLFGCVVGRQAVLTPANLNCTERRESGAIRAA